MRSASTSPLINTSGSAYERKVSKKSPSKNPYDSSASVCPRGDAGALYLHPVR